MFNDSDKNVCLIFPAILLCLSVFSNKSSLHNQYFGCVQLRLSKLRTCTSKAAAAVITLVLGERQLNVMVDVNLHVDKSRKSFEGSLSGDI